MGTTLQLLHDTDANLATYTGSNGEMVVSTTDGRPRTMDGATAGGKKLALLADLTPGAWQVPTLLSPWIAYGGGFQSPRYRKDTAGMVTVEGLVQAPGGTATASVTIFNLLAGYRPAADYMFICWCGGGAMRVDVKSTGDVIMQACNTAFSSLTGIQFYID